MPGNAGTPKLGGGKSADVRWHNTRKDPKPPACRKATASGVAALRALRRGAQERWGTTTGAGQAGSRRLLALAAKSAARHCPRV